MMALLGYLLAVIGVMLIGFVLAICLAAKDSRHENDDLRDAGFSEQEIESRCAWCPKTEALPRHNATVITHGMCPKCAASFRHKAGLDNPSTLN